MIDLKDKEKIERVLMNHNMVVSLMYNTHDISPNLPFIIHNSRQQSHGETGYPALTSTLFLGHFNPLASSCTDGFYKKTFMKPLAIFLSVLLLI